MAVEFPQDSFHFSKISLKSLSAVQLHCRENKLMDGSRMWLLNSCHPPKADTTLLWVMGARVLVWTLQIAWLEKKSKCWRHNSKSNVLGCGRTAAVVLQILVLLLQEESDFTAAQDTYYLRVKESWESCSLITDLSVLNKVPGQRPTEQLCKHWWVSVVEVLIRDACWWLL